MKRKRIKSITVRLEWHLLTVALTVVVSISFGFVPGATQQKSEKRILSVRASNVVEGSKVSVVADLAISDYEAYRRGDRFYVKFPAASFTGAQPHLSGAAFDDVEVQKASDSVILSFKMQPGTSARVDQRFNQLDVVFTSFGRNTPAAAPANNSVQGADKHPTEVAVPAASSSRDSRNPDRPQESSASTAGNGGSTAAGSSDVAPGVSTGNSNASSLSAVLSQNAGIQPARSTETASPIRAVSPNNRSPLILWMTQNWVIALVPLLLILFLIGYFATRSRNRYKRNVKWRPAEGSTVKPKAATGETLDFGDVKSYEFADEPLINPEPQISLNAEEVIVPDVDLPAIPLEPLPTRFEQEVEKEHTSAEDSLEVKGSMEEEPISNPRASFDRADFEVKKILSGREYDTSVIDSSDAATRQAVATQLLAALASRNYHQHEPALRAFMDHGYFDEVTRDLRTADSPDERASAAQKLGLVCDPISTAHLIAALYDSSPEVRRSAVESLGQVGEPAAISALKDLMARETSRQVPGALIRHAIDSIATAVTKRSAPSPSTSEKPTLRVVEKTGERSWPRHENEAFIEFMGTLRKREETEVFSAPQPVAVPRVSGAIDSHLSEEEVRLLAEEEALLLALEELEQKRIAAESARLKAEDAARLKAETEAEARAQIEARIRAEEEARRRAEEEAARRQMEEENRIRAEREARIQAEEEARLRAEDEARFRIEAETLRRAAEELTRKREAAEISRKLAEQEARRRAEVQAKLLADEQARLGNEEESRWRAEEEARSLAEQVKRAEEEARNRAEKEARQRAEEDARMQAEDQAILKAAEEARRREVEQQQLREVEELRQVEEQRLLAEQEALIRAASELARRRAEIEQARKKAEKESKLLQALQERMRAEEENRRRTEEQRQQLEAEARRRADEECQRLEEAQRRADEEQRQLEQMARSQAAEQNRRLEELEAVRKRVEEEARQRSEQEKRIQAEIDALRRAEEEQRERIEAETRRRAAAEARIREGESRRMAEEQARLKAEQEAERLAEEARLRAEEEARQRAEKEARRHAEAEESRLWAEEESRRAIEERMRAEEQVLRNSQEGVRLLDEAHARLLAEEEARSRDEEEPNPASQSENPGEYLFTLSPEEAVPEFVGTLESEPAVDAFPEQPPQSSDDESGIPADLLSRLKSDSPAERAAALNEVAALGGDEAFQRISKAFDDQSADVRNAAARALFFFQTDRAASFTRTLREGSPERRRRIGAAVAASGLASDAITNLTGESREKTYDAFSLLFLMAKAGEVQPLMRSIEDHPNVEARLAVVKLLALSGQPEIVPAFRRLAVRGTLPSEVRSAVMEAIYQISTQTRETAPSAA